MFSTSLVLREPFQLTGRYADRNRFEVINGPGDSRVTGSQIIIDEKLTDAWGGKVILVTGVSSGVGVETYETQPAGANKLWLQ